MRSDVAVVAGGANGIGLAITKQFAAEGARVAVLDRDPKTAEVASQVAREHEVETTGVVCDIADFASVENAVDSAVQRLGGVDHVVLAAAIGSGKFGYPFLNLSPADWEQVIKVNLLGAVHVAHAFAPRLIQKKAGTFLFISSVAAQFGSPTDPPYSATKAALLNFAQCMARDLAPHNVRVNSVCPGMVKTALNRSVWKAWNDLQPPGKKRSYEDWAGEKVRTIVPLGRWQEPEEIASMVVFLASPCAKSITGQTVNVDGGYIMR